jgi:endonuclease III
MDTEQAREELLKFVGVGRKVADCVLLMSMDKVSPIFLRLSNELTLYHRSMSFRSIHTFIRSP